MAAGEPAARLDGGGGGLMERYEELRRRVLGGQPDGFRLGLAILQRQGMSAWMRAWDDLGQPVGGTPVFPPPPSPPAVSQSVVSVLASMTLACAAAGGVP